MHKCVIIGGWTFSFVAHHLSLAAPAFGQTAKVLAKMFEQTCLTPVLKLTKMADSTSEIITNQDVHASHCKEFTDDVEFKYLTQKSSPEDRLTYAAATGNLLWFDRFEN